MIIPSVDSESDSFPFTSKTMPSISVPFTLFQILAFPEIGWIRISKKGWPTPSEPLSQA